jgi:hypothetical protein
VETGEKHAGKRPCVVCRWPNDADIACHTCGWDGDAADPSAVAVGQGHWDALAAWRATDGDDDGVALLRPLLRGPAPAPVTGPPDTAVPARPATDPVVLYGRRRGVVVVGVEPAGVDLVLLDVDDAGALAVVDRRRLPWPDLLPALADRPLVLRFHLAGGIGTAGVDPAALRATIEANLPGDVLRDRTVVLARTTPGWALLDRVGAGGGPSVDWRGIGVEEAERQLAGVRPLARPYDLVLSRATPDGRVEVTTTELFPAGTVPEAVCTGAVRVPDDVAGPVALPIVICRERDGDRRGALLPVASWKPVRIGSLSRAAGTELSMTVRLDRSGAVAFEGADDIGDENRTWTDLLMARAATPSTDLVLAVEISGDRAPDRLAFVADVLRGLAGGPFRVLVVGYWQHDNLRRAGDALPPVRTVGFTTPDASPWAVG